MLGYNKAIVIVAKDEWAIVGVVGGWLEGTPSGYEEEDDALRKHGAYEEAHLDWIAVKEEYREKGIGTALIKKVCKWAMALKKRKIWMEASKDKVEFYQRHGFK